MSPLQKETGLLWKQEMKIMESLFLLDLVCSHFDSFIFVMLPVLIRVCLFCQLVIRVCLF